MLGTQGGAWGERERGAWRPPGTPAECSLENRGQNASSREVREELMEWGKRRWRQVSHCLEACLRRRGGHLKQPDQEGSEPLGKGGGRSSLCFR